MKMLGYHPCQEKYFMSLQPENEKKKIFSKCKLFRGGWRRKINCNSFGFISSGRVRIGALKMLGYHPCQENNLVLLRSASSPRPFEMQIFRPGSAPPGLGIAAPSQFPKFHFFQNRRSSLFQIYISADTRPNDTKPVLNERQGPN